MTETIKPDNSKMINRSFLRNAVSKIISAESGTIATVIDSIIISKYLGADAMGSYGIAMPMLYFTIAVAKLTSDGGARQCGVSIGKGDRKQTDSFFSTTIILALVLSVFFMLLFLFAPGPVSKLLGAKGAAEGYLAGASEFLKGFAWGIPFYVLGLTLIPFAQLEGKISVVSIAGYSVAATDVVLDFANVYIFRQGLWGMAFATSISQFVGAMIMCIALFGRNSEFKFSVEYFDEKKIKKLVRDGIPGFLSYFFTSVRSIVANHAIAAFLPIWILPINSGVSSLMNLFYPVGKGIGSTVMVFSSVFYGEEDTNGLKVILRISNIFTVAVNFVLMVVLIVFAPFLLGIFLSLSPEEMSMGYVGVRIMALSLVPFAIHTVYRSYMQGIGRIFSTTLFLAIYEIVISGMCVYALTAAFSVTGFWNSFLVREILTVGLILLFIMVISHINKKGLPITAPYLLIYDGFGIDEEKRLEASLHKFSEIDGFLEKTKTITYGDERSENIISCIHSMGNLVFNNKFPKKETPELRIRLYLKNGKWILHFRDNGNRLDPTNQEDISYAGSSVKYIRSLNENALILTF